MKAVNLKTDHMANPMGISFPHPTLSWVAEGGQQKAYEVEAFVHGTKVWETGRVDGPSNSVRIGYEAGSRERVTWRVRLWEVDGIPSEWSESWYEMGLLSESDWKARWIDPEYSFSCEERRPSSVLGKEFTVEGEAGSVLLSLLHLLQ